MKVNVEGAKLFSGLGVRDVDGKNALSSFVMISRCPQHLNLFEIFIRDPGIEGIQ